MKDPLCEGFVQHLSVPLLESLWLGDLLIGGVAVEDVVVSLTGRTRPDVALSVAAEPANTSDKGWEKPNNCICESRPTPAF